MGRKLVTLRRIASERLPSAFREGFRERFCERFCETGGRKRAFTRAARMASIRSAVAVRRGGGEGASVTYAGVLDGGTLNLQVRLPSRAGHAPVRAVRLVAGRGHRRWRGDLDLDGDLAGGAIRLSEDGGPLSRLGTGLWRTRIELTLADGSGLEVPLLGPVEDVLPAGPTVAAPLCPRTGTVYTVDAGLTGHVTISASRPAPQAHVTGVIADWDRVVVEGRLGGTVRTVGAEVLMRRLEGSRLEGSRLEGRGGREACHRLPVTTDGELFRFEVPGGSLAGAETTWVFEFVSPRTGTLKVGRSLDDFRHPHRVVHHERRPVAASERSLLYVRPGYSPAGRLQLSCSHSEDLP
ncbi:hypothetical protein AB0M44_18265 [Streptosporangium subroseum]|uniref:hypothetical protein n=1 Tax=Streptosporangium subroseum TaxID=106412 RepID=UPI0034356DE1